MSDHHSTNLKPHRKRSGFTQEELGFLLGQKKHSTISRHEVGDRSPDLKTAFAYQVLFDCELHDLFSGLHGNVRAEVGKRARGLSEEIKRAGDNRHAAYKLEKLARLEKKGLENSPAV